MFDDAALALEEIAPEDKNRTEVLGARVNRYMAAQKFCERPERATRLTCARNWIQATVRLLRES
jgi:hypothetical protein